MNLLILTQKVDKEDDNLGFFHAWLERFSARTENLFVICNYLGKNNLPQNAKVFSLGKEKQHGRLKRYATFYREIFSLIPKSDAVFVHMIPAWVILVWPLAFIYRKKIYLWYTHKSVTPSLWLAEKLVTKIFTASSESCRIKSDKILVTGHGIDTNHFAPSREVSMNAKEYFENNLTLSTLPKSQQDGYLKFLAVGRIAPSKNYEFLIAVAEDLKKRIVNKRIILDIVGAPITLADFNYKKRLKDLIGQKKLQNNINFLGAKTYSEMPDIYNSHDILLHASETGSVDKAVLEAMACGLPVVVTSRAFKEMIPIEYYMEDKNVIYMADKIVRMIDDKKNISVRQKDFSLRELVIKNHNLDNLIDKIMVSIKT